MMTYSPKALRYFLVFLGFYRGFLGIFLDPPLAFGWPVRLSSCPKACPTIGYDACKIHCQIRTTLGFDLAEFIDSRVDMFLSPDSLTNDTVTDPLVMAVVWYAWFIFSPFCILVAYRACYVPHEKSSPTFTLICKWLCVAHTILLIVYLGSNLTSAPFLGYPHRSSNWPILLICNTLEIAIPIVWYLHFVTYATPSTVKSGKKKK